HQVLAGQEDERKKISCELQNEIAQTLLGVNVRLLSLKQEARTNTKGLKNEIARAQRLVTQAAQLVRSFARRLDHPDETHEKKDACPSPDKARNVMPCSQDESCDN